MINAKEELISHIKDRKVEFVSIAISKGYDEPPVQIKGALNDVLSQMNFSYDNGWGGQELFGYIWYEDGSWSERGEYDGSEWWEHKVRPDHNVKVTP